MSEIAGRGTRDLSEEHDLKVSVQESASVTLLVSVLVSNAVKHGKGDIDLELTVGTASARLEVCDDGPGFPADFDWRSAANTGISLIDSTGRHDLRGTIHFITRTGPRAGRASRSIFRFLPLPSSPHSSKGGFA